MSQSAAEKMAMEASLAEAPPSRRVTQASFLPASMRQRKPFNASANPWPRASAVLREWWCALGAVLNEKGR